MGTVMRSKPVVYSLGFITAFLAALVWLRPNEGTAQAAPTAAPIAKHATPAATVLDSIRTAEKITDPMQRCVAIPAPRDFHWPKETTNAFCADELTPTLTWDEFKNAIDDGKTAEIDARLDALVEGYFSGRVPEGALRHAYHDSFWGSSAERKRLIDQWHTKAPASAHALAARGMWWIANAEQARGEKLIGDTPEKDVRKMDNALTNGKRDLQKAIALNPRIMPAYAALIFAAKFDADNALADNMMQKAIEIDPANFYSRAALAYKLRPQWGGSFEAMDKVAADAEQYVSKNPRLVNLKAIALAERGMTAYWAHDYPEALKQFDKGLAFGPEWFYLNVGRYAASTSGDEAQAVELMTQMLRFSPHASETRRQRAQALVKLGREDWAQEELDDVLRVDPRDAAAIASYADVLIHRNDFPGAELKLKQLIAANPNDRWANVTLAWLYSKRMRRFDDAKAMLDEMQKKEPEAGDLWLMRVQLLDSSGGPGMREAIEGFLRYADARSKEQRDTIPIAKQWLASHPK